MMKEVVGFEGAIYGKLPTAKDATAFVDQYNKKPNRYYTNVNNFNNIKWYFSSPNTW